MSADMVKLPSPLFFPLRFQIELQEMHFTQQPRSALNFFFLLQAPVKTPKNLLLELDCCTKILRTSSTETSLHVCPSLAHDRIQNIDLAEVFLLS